MLKCTWKHLVIIRQFKLKENAIGVTFHKVSRRFCHEHFAKKKHSPPPPKWVSNGPPLINLP